MVSKVASLSTAAWPIVTLTFFENQKVDDETIKDYFQQFEAIYALQKPFFLLIDTRNISGAPPSFLLKQVKYLKKKEPLSKKYLKHVSICVNSNIIRSIIQGIFKLKPAVCPIEVSKEFDEASAIITSKSSQEKQSWAKSLQQSPELLSITRTVIMCYIINRSLLPKK